MKLVKPLMRGSLKKYRGSPVLEIVKKCIEVVKTQASEDFYFIE